jgi:hypothetical protein
MTTRIRSLLPHGEDHISAISRYMTQPQGEGKAEEVSTKTETECEVKGESANKGEDEVEVCVTLQDIQQSLSQLQAEIKAKNVEVVLEMARQVIDTYGYRTQVPLRLIA